MKGRPNIYDDRELVLKAQELFWQKGYSATSLADLSKATGAGAGSLYNTFKGGKKELFQKSLQQRKKDFYEFEQQIENSDNPIQLIKSFFLDLANADKNAHLKGCIIANTVVEMACVNDELEKMAVEILRETEQLYTKTILAEQKKGTIKTRIPADSLGKFLITLWCGINSLRRIYPDKDILKQQIELQLKIIE